MLTYKTFTKAYILLEAAFGGFITLNASPVAILLFAYGQHSKISIHFVIRLFVYKIKIYSIKNIIMLLYPVFQMLKTLLI
ncbi:hypothetical protein J2Y67_001897 [Neobacillus niacini]|nr:hypothetical protein [Neobacillus niacini]